MSRPDATPSHVPTETTDPTAAPEITGQQTTEPLDEEVELASKRLNWIGVVAGFAAAIFVFGGTSFGIASRLATKADMEAAFKTRDERLSAELKPLQQDVEQLKLDRAAAGRDVDWLKQSNVRMEHKLDLLIERLRIKDR